MTLESELIRRSVDGDEAAFARLAADHRPVSVAVARGMLGDPDAAEDVAQEAMIRLSSALPGFRGDSELRTWVYRVTINLCHDHLRRQRRRRDEVSVESGLGDPALVSQPEADQRLVAERRRAVLYEALGRLPEEQRVAVTLRFLSDLPYGEIARLTDAPIGTVASRVFRALERLGADMEPKHLEMLK
ncbi:MAG: sigma-70 family RNA polymerase sigma factor [Gemmatimonadota bacterium]|nr:sigma-70 family RNA polymerase sigma factor [Gemmatimonadota bacterium]